MVASGWHYQGISINSLSVHFTIDISCITKQRNSQSVDDSNDILAKFGKSSVICQTKPSNNNLLADLFIHKTFLPTSLSIHFHQTLLLPNFSTIWYFPNLLFAYLSRVKVLTWESLKFTLFKKDSTSKFFLTNNIWYDSLINPFLFKKLCHHLIQNIGKWQNKYIWSV